MIKEACSIKIGLPFYVSDEKNMIFPNFNYANEIEVCRQISQNPQNSSDNGQQTSDIRQQTVHRVSVSKNPLSNEFCAP
jgi:hypothetical protein